MASNWLIHAVRDAAATERPRFLSAEDVRALHLELNVSEQCSSSGGGHLISQFAEGLPPGFKGFELGFHFSNAEKDILQTTLSLQSSNSTRRKKLKREIADLYAEYVADARRRGVRPADSKPSEAIGCDGCPACVPGTRAQPRRSSDPKRARDFLSPSDVLLSSVHAARKRRRSGARSQMNARRAAEQEIVREVARRALRGDAAVSPPSEK